MKALVMWSVILGVSLGLAEGARARTTVVEERPVQTVFLPADEKAPDVAQVVLAFDLPTVANGNLPFLEATLEWTAPFVEVGGAYEFEAYAVTEPWEAAEVAARAVAPATGLKPLGYWGMEGKDIDRYGGMVRIRLTQAVKQWLKGKPNYGIVLKVWGAERELKSEDLSNLAVKISVIGAE